MTFVDPCIVVQFIKKNQQDATVYQNFIIPYLYEAQHVSGDTPPIVRSRQRTFLSPAGANSRNWNVKPALYAATATKTVQAAKVNKSLQFRRRLRDFFAPVWGLPLVAVYVPVHDKIRSEGFAVAANISRRSGGAFKHASCCTRRIRLASSRLSGKVVASSSCVL